MFNPSTIRLVDVARFSIIYSFEIQRGDLQHIENFLPPKEQRQQKLWQVTEQCESELNSCLDLDDEYLRENPKKKWLHWKFCGILNFAQFIDFLWYANLGDNQCGTMGSIGAPGFGFGWSPAIAFQGTDSDADQNAYVTPCFDIDYHCEWQPVVDLLENIAEQLCELWGDDEYQSEWTLSDVADNWYHADQLTLAMGE